MDTLTYVNQTSREGGFRISYPTANMNFKLQENYAGTQSVIWSKETAGKEMVKCLLHLATSPVSIPPAFFFLKKFILRVYYVHWRKHCNITFIAANCERCACLHSGTTH